jgi:hypothetical protein
MMTIEDYLGAYERIEASFNLQLHELVDLPHAPIRGATAARASHPKPGGVTHVARPT